MAVTEASKSPVMRFGAGVIFLFFLYVMYVISSWFKAKFKPTKKPGEKCSTNRQCIDLNCGYTDADSAMKQCCSTVLGNGGKHICSNLPDGSPCTSNAKMCAGGLCVKDPVSGNMLCSSGKEVNETCVKSGDCKNSACGIMTPGDSNKICCPSGTTTGFGGVTYCSGKGASTVCWTDATCLSNVCVGNKGGTVKGVCGTGTAGGFCKIDSDCPDGACAYDNGSKTKVCCASGDRKNNYCTNQSDGATCGMNGQCVSGFCNLSTNKCSGNIASGGSCLTNKDCGTDGICAKGGSGGSMMCCTSGNSLGAYCTQLINGDQCIKNNQCDSGICKGNGGGTKIGICAAGHTGDTCNINADCINVCKGGKCT